MNPIYNRAKFLISVADLSQLPSGEGAEVAFAGRSNAGKSSALNTIAGIKALARTSKTPGRTQLLNFFDLDDGHYLVDLPGYGYAKVPEAMQRRWQQTLADYLGSRRSLRGLVLVMDVRHPLTPFDDQLLAWCHQAGMPVHVLLTKCDKLSRGAAANTLMTVRRTLGQRGLLASVQLFSSLNKLGVDEVHAVLDDWLGYASRG